MGVEFNMSVLINLIIFFAKVLLRKLFFAALMFKSNLSSCTHTHTRAQKNLIQSLAKVTLFKVTGNANSRWLVLNLVLKVETKKF